MKAVVHIGTGKAGSTSIQKSTFAHRATLLENGIIVPELYEREINPRPLAEAITGQKTQIQTSQIRSAIDAKIQKHKPHSLFMSSEFLYLNPSAITALEKFIAPWTSDLEVVLYLREPVAFYVSFCQQQLKGV